MPLQSLKGSMPTNYKLPFSFDPLFLIFFLLDFCLTVIIDVRMFGL